LKSKKADEVLKNFQDIIESEKIHMTNLMSDLGREFISTLKCSIVERVIRTMKGRLFKYFHRNSTFQWIDKPQFFVDEYNNSVSSKEKDVKNVSTSISR
jgi:hypothetical protein